MYKTSKPSLVYLWGINATAPFYKFEFTNLDHKCEASQKCYALDIG